MQGTATGLHAHAERYILEVVLEREPGSGSIHLSAYGCIAPTRLYICYINRHAIRISALTTASVLGPLDRLYVKRSRVRQRGGGKNISNFRPTNLRPHKHIYAQCLLGGIPTHLDVDALLDHFPQRAHGAELRGEDGSGGGKARR